MKDRTRQQDRIYFLAALYGIFVSQDVKTRKGKTIYVSPICADIIISKAHGLAEVIP